MYPKSLPKLSYLSESPYVPIPPAEQLLQTVTAEPFVQVSEESEQLEGLCFDRRGDLYFLSVYTGKVYRLQIDTKSLSIAYTLPEGLHPAALKIHKDGRHFFACLGDFDAGCICAVDPDGKNLQMIVPPEKGYAMDDMVFDRDGGFYFTNFKGFSTEPTGGIFYVTPDFQTITPVLKNLATPNGIALTPDEKGLWVTEMSRNLLHFIELSDDKVHIPHHGTSIPYHFTGYKGPDSCCIDSEGNLYVAMYMQGRFLAFNKAGYPTGQVLIPGREHGHMLRSTHPMLRPGTDELYMCANDFTYGGGAWIFAARGFAKAHKSYQFQ